MWKRKKTKTFNDATVEDLLKDFLESDNDVENQNVTNIDDEEYINMMLKKDAKRILQEHRKKQPIAQSSSHETQKSDQQIASEKISIIKRCQNCYYCVDSYSLGGSVWCNCTNPGRSSHSDASKSWIKSKLNLPCWKAIKD